MGSEASKYDVLTSGIPQNAQVLLLTAWRVKEL